jgi:riboflavin biosynthesis pyrimidine reductase
MMLAPSSDSAPIALQPLLVDATSGSGSRGGVLPDALRDRYGGDLAIPLRTDRPTVVSNFVSTLDGVVSYNTPEGAGGGEISGFFEPDRFVMGLLRALADVVLIGAGTLRAAPVDAWTPGFIHPRSALSFTALRSRLGLRPNPITAVVSASGNVDLRHPGLWDPAVEVVIVTSDAGSAALRDQRVSTHADIRAVGDRVKSRDIVETLAFHGAELVLCEGGPHLLGQLLADDLVDELFLTFAPQIAGRSTLSPRLGLVEETAFDLADARWGRLADLRSAGDHLFARYRLSERKDS